LPFALLDLEAGTKAQLVVQAEGKGPWTLAVCNYGLLLVTLSPFWIVCRHQKSSTVALTQQRERIILYAVVSSPLEVRALNAKRGSRDVMQPLWSLIEQFPPAGMLLTVLNQTGAVGIGTVIAAGLLAQIETKQLDPVNDPDAVFSAMVYGLDYVVGRKERKSVFATFGVSEMQGEKAGELIDRALARFALAPYMRENEKEPPSRSAVLAASFPWQQWVKTAGELKSGRTIPEQDRLVAAELLIAADRPSDALVLLKASIDLEDGDAACTRAASRSRQPLQ
jgi:hypothetical protein